MYFGIFGNANRHYIKDWLPLEIVDDIEVIRSSIKY